jgi:hypothetical protein
VHTGAGLYVEVHRAAPDGPLIRRIAVAHDREATVWIEKLRDTMLRSGLEAISGEIEPLIPRGSVIVHAGHPRTLQPVAALDRGPATFLCAQLWVSPGAHLLSSAFVSDKLAIPPDPDVAKTHGRAGIEVDVAKYATVELYYSFYLRRLLRHRPTHMHWPCEIRYRGTA